MYFNDGPTCVESTHSGEGIDTPINETNPLPDSIAKELPDHLLVDILGEFLHGEVKTFCFASQACKSWSSALSNEPFWNRCLVSRFGSDERVYHPGHMNYESSCRSREVYAATHCLERRFSSGEFSRRSWDRFDASLTDVLISGEKIYIGDNKGRIHLHDPELLTPSLHLNSVSGVSCLAVNSDLLFSGHADGTVKLWGANNIDPVRPIPVHEPNSRVNAIASPNSGCFASSSPVDMTVRLVDISKESEFFMRPFSPESSPNSLAVSSPNVFLVGCRDNCARVIDIRSREREALLMQLTDWCLCVEWSSEFTVRASDKAVHVFDLRFPGSPVSVHHASKRLITKFKSDAVLRLVSCGLDGQVNVSSIDEAVPRTMMENDYILSLDFSRTTLCFGDINGLFQSLQY